MTDSPHDASLDPGESAPTAPSRIVGVQAPSNRDRVRAALLPLGVPALLLALVWAVWPTRPQEFHRLRLAWTEPTILAGGVPLNRPLLAVGSEGDAVVSWIQKEGTYLAREQGSSWREALIPEAPQTASAWWPSALAREGNTLFLVQAPHLETGPGGIVFLGSTDAGDTWSSPLQLSDVTGLRAYCRGPALASDGAELVVVFNRKKQRNELRPGDNKTGGAKGLFVTRSQDGGASWSRAELIDLPVKVRSVASVAPVLQLDQGILYLAYGPVFRSEDLGRTWSELYEPETELLAAQSQLRIDSQGRLHLAWRRATVLEDKTGVLGGGTMTIALDVVYVRSGEGGSGWSAPLRLSDTTTTFKLKKSKITDSTGGWMRANLDGQRRHTDLFDLAVSPDGEAVAGLWKDYRDEEERLYLSCSTDGGASWSRSSEVSPQATYFSSASLGLGSREGDGWPVHVVWGAFDPEMKSLEVSPGDLWVRTGTVQHGSGR